MTQPAVHASPAAPRLPQSWLPSRVLGWGIIVVPVLTGVTIALWRSELHIVDLMLGLAWIVGHLAYCAADAAWRRPAGAARADKRAAISLIVAAAVLVAGTLALDPVIATWLLLLGPLLLIGMRVLVRQVSVFVAGLADAAAAALVMPMFLSHQLFETPSGLWVVASLQLFTFIGCSLVNQTVDKQRSDPAVGSVTVMYHVSVLCLLSAEVVAQWLSLLVVPFAVILLGRAMGLQVLAARRTRAHKPPVPRAAVEVGEGIILVLLIVVSIL